METLAALALVYVAWVLVPYGFTRLLNPRPETVDRGDPK